MLKLFDLIIQWITSNQVPQMNAPWWIDTLATIAFIALVFAIGFYVNKLAVKNEKREKAIDELINSHRIGSETKEKEVKE